MLKYNIVVSANNNNIIGIHNNLFIECKDDLKRFSNERRRDLIG